MEDLNNLNRKTHKVLMNNRRNINITGVNDVLSFDVKEVLLETEHVSRLMLDKGEVDVEGKIDSLTYSENNSFSKKSESLLAKLFK